MFTTRLPVRAQVQTAPVTPEERHAGTASSRQTGMDHFSCVNTMTSVVSGKGR